MEKGVQREAETDKKHVRWMALVCLSLDLSLEDVGCVVLEKAAQQRGAKHKTQTWEGAWDCRQKGRHGGIMKYLCLWGGKFFGVQEAMC